MRAMPETKTEYKRNTHSNTSELRNNHPPSKDDEALPISKCDHTRTVTLAVLACNSRGSYHIPTHQIPLFPRLTPKASGSALSAIKQNKIPRLQEFLKAGFAGILHLGNNDFASSDVLCSSPGRTFCRLLSDVVHDMHANGSRVGRYLVLASALCLSEPFDAIEIPCRQHVLRAYSHAVVFGPFQSCFGLRMKNMPERPSGDETKSLGSSSRR